MCDSFGEPLLSYYHKSVCVLTYDDDIISDETKK